MHAGGRPEHARVRLRQARGFLIAFVTAAGHDDPGHARVGGALQNLGAVVVETVVSEICANVDQVFHRLSPGPSGSKTHRRPKMPGSIVSA
jgi:hypothetical protein